jgi:hypothetical protein
MMVEMTVKPTVERTLRERFNAHLVIPEGAETDPARCFGWRGATHNHTGAGVFQVAKGPGGHMTAPRVAFSLEWGQVLPWQVIKPVVCGNKLCVRASHWRLIPSAKRRMKRTRRYSARRREELLAFMVRLGAAETARTFAVPAERLERWARDARRREALNGATHEGVHE